MKKFAMAAVAAATLIAASPVHAADGGEQGRGYDPAENSAEISAFLAALDTCAVEMKGQANVGYNEIRDCALAKTGS